MWLLTYVGALFNGLTLLILGELMSELQAPMLRDIDAPSYERKIGATWREIIF